MEARICNTSPTGFCALGIRQQFTCGHKSTARVLVARCERGLIPETGCTARNPPPFAGREVRLCCQALPVAYPPTEKTRVTGGGRHCRLLPISAHRAPKDVIGNAHAEPASCAVHRAGHTGLSMSRAAPGSAPAWDRHRQSRLSHTCAAPVAPKICICAAMAAAGQLARRNCCVVGPRKLNRAPRHRLRSACSTRCARCLRRSKMFCPVRRTPRMGALACWRSSSVRLWSLARGTPSRRNGCRPRKPHSDRRGARGPRFEAVALARHHYCCMYPRFGSCAVGWARTATCASASRWSGNLASSTRQPCTACSAS